MFFEALAGFFQIIVDVVGGILSALVFLLPSSPFTWFDGSDFSVLLAKINYFVPIYDFVSILELWIVAVGLFYLYSVFARWLKAIE